MKALKCCIAVLLGTILGLLPSCASKEMVPDQVPKPSVKEPTKSTEKTTKSTAPQKEENLPMRNPIYE